MLQAVNLAEKLALFSDTWHPRIVGELNGQEVKVVKLQGEFVWHHHENEDELFLVLQGQMIMMLREAGAERQVIVNPGEFIIVPKRVEHKPVAPEEVHIMLLEPASTLNTGNIKEERTHEVLERI